MSTFICASSHLSSVMNLIRILVATLLLFSNTLINPFQVDAFNSEFKANQNTSQLKLENGTLLVLDGIGSIDTDNESTTFVTDNLRIPNFNLSLKAFADKSQSAEFLDPKSVPENVNTMSPTVEETSAPREYRQETPDNKVKGDFSSTEGEQDNDSSNAYPGSTLMNSATESLDEPEITGTEQILINMSAQRITASTDDPPTQPGLLPVDGDGSSGADLKSTPFVKGNQSFSDFTADLKDFANQSQSISVLEPKSVPQNTETMSPKEEDAQHFRTPAPRDHLEIGLIGKRDFSGADGVQENLVSSAPENAANANQRVLISGQQDLNSFNLAASGQTEDPPAQPDKLLLAKLKELDELKANTDKASKANGAGQFHVAAVHGVSVFISMMTLSFLIQLLLER